jgi:hypothetical protein
MSSNDLDHMKRYAQKLANETGSSVLIFRATHLPANALPVYGVAFTLPPFATRIGDRIYPQGDAV